MSSISSFRSWNWSAAVLVLPLLAVGCGGSGKRTAPTSAPAAGTTLPARGSAAEPPPNHPAGPAAPPAPTAGAHPAPLPSPAPDGGPGQTGGPAANGGSAGPASGPGLPSAAVVAWLTGQGIPAADLQFLAVRERPAPHAPGTERVFTFRRLLGGVPVRGPHSELDLVEGPGGAVRPAPGCGFTHLEPTLAPEAVRRIDPRHLAEAFLAAHPAYQGMGLLEATGPTYVMEALHAPHARVRPVVHVALEEQGPWGPRTRFLSLRADGPDGSVPELAGEAVPAGGPQP